MFWQGFVPAMWEVRRLQKLFFAHKVPKQMHFFDTSNVGYMSSIWYRQIRHSGDAKSTCGCECPSDKYFDFQMQINNILTGKGHRILLEADALSLSAGQMHRCNCKWHRLSLTHNISRLHPGLELCVVFNLQVHLSLVWVCWLQSSKQGPLYRCTDNGSPGPALRPAIFTQHWMPNSNQVVKSSWYLCYY